MRETAVPHPNGGGLVNPRADVHPEAFIGQGTRVHAFAYIEGGVVIGMNCVVKPHAFICTGVTIHDHVFIGPGAVFTNDRYPRANQPFDVEPTIVHSLASIGAGAVILPGLTIGERAIVGAGAVVTKHVSPDETWKGNPARSRSD